MDARLETNQATHYLKIKKKEKEANHWKPKKWRDLEPEAIRKERHGRKIVTLFLSQQSKYQVISVVITNLKWKKAVVLYLKTTFL